VPLIILIIDYFSLSDHPSLYTVDKFYVFPLSHLRWFQNGGLLSKVTQLKTLVDKLLEMNADVGVTGNANTSANSFITYVIYDI
jgi:hypothetical protein